MVRQPVEKLEVEVRARAPHDIGHSLNKLGAQRKENVHEHDEYFKFALDTDRKLVLRIRTRENGAVLTFKGSSKVAEDIAWQEWETAAPNPDHLKQLLLTNGFVPVVTIDKRRTSYLLGELTINVDHIAQLGDFVEAEVLTTDVQAGEQEILRFFERIGIAREAVVKQGYVPLMLEKIKNSSPL